MPGRTTPEVRGRSGRIWVSSCAMSDSPRRVVSAESTRCSGTVFPECKQDYRGPGRPPGREAYPAGQVFERFTDRARRSVVLAQEEARMLNHNYIGTEHILLGLVHEHD